MRSNFKYHLVSLPLLISVANPLITFAQTQVSSICSGSVKNCINQLEIISNAHSQLLIQLQQQLSDNQNDIDMLRGQIQENQHKLNQVVERQKQIWLEINEFSSNRTEKSIPIEKTEDSTQESHRDDDTDYNAVIALVQDKSQQENAIVALQNFIRKYPDSTFLPNANYWLGQLNYNKSKKDEAIYYFASVVKNYPKSQKAPDAMLKVGIIMQDKGDLAKAKTVYQQVVVKYPGTESARQAQKRLRSMKY